MFLPEPDPTGDKIAGAPPQYTELIPGIAGIPYWDSLIVASAETADCAWLLSEDIQAGQRFNAVTVVNPFRSGPEEFGLS